MGGTQWSRAFGLFLHMLGSVAFPALHPRCSRWRLLGARRVRAGIPQSSGMFGEGRMRNKEEFWNKVVIYGMMGFSRIFGLFFKRHSVLKVHGKEVFLQSSSVGGKD